MRAKAGSFLSLCYNPQLAALVTLQPLKRYDLDAAIVFSDILVVPHAMGLDLNFKEGEGPILQKVGNENAVARLSPVNGSWQVASVCETLQHVSQLLPQGCALIGFCGAPWTVASYMIEGGSSNRSLALKAAAEKPAWFATLIAFLIEQSVVFLSAQIKAGAEVVQIFDSWAADLSSPLRQLWVDGPIAQMTERLRALHPDIPVIVFAKGVGEAHQEIAQKSGCQAVGIEAELSMDWASKHLSPLCAVQGNLDPMALLGSEPSMVEQTAAILQAIEPRHHIFNLGHGIKPETDPDRLARVVQTIREHDAGGHG